MPAVEAGCTGKMAYASAGSAWKNLNRLNSTRERRQAPADVYHCPICERWHIGRSNETRARAVTKLLKERRKEARRVVWDE